MMDPVGGPVDPGDKPELIVAKAIFAIWGARAIDKVRHKYNMSVGEAQDFVYEASYETACCFVKKYDNCWEDPSALEAILKEHSHYYLVTVVKNKLTDALVKQCKDDKAKITWDSPFTANGTLTPEDVVADDRWNPWLCLESELDREESEQVLVDLREALQTLTPRQRAAWENSIDPHSDAAGRSAKNSGERVALKEARDKLRNDLERRRIFRELFGTWMERSKALPGDDVEEAIVNVVAVGGQIVSSSAGAALPPSAEERESVRTTDLLYEYHYPKNEPARLLYRQGIELQRSADQGNEGDVYEQALRNFAAVRVLEPEFTAVRFSIAAIHFVRGELGKARDECLDLLRETSELSVQAWAASNLADIYMTVYAKTKRHKDIMEAVRYAELALQVPDPAYVVNAVITLAKAGRNIDAATVLRASLEADHPHARNSDIVALLRRIQDKDLHELWKFMVKHQEG